MPEMIDFLVVGDYCLDLIFTGLDQMPVMGQEVVSKGFDMLPGATYNTVVALKRLGANIRWACDFGTDDYSRWVYQKTMEEGINPELFIQHNRPLRNITVSMSSPENRAFLAYYDPAPTLPAGFKNLLKVNAKVLFIPGVYTGALMDVALKAIKARGMKLVMDGNSYENTTLKQPNLQKLLRNLDVFLPNRQETLRMTGETSVEAALNVLGSLCPLVVVKAGSEGAYAYQHGEIVQVPPIPVKVIDTTGAGDCFNAGFLTAWLEDRPLIECLQWGNIVGGLSTQKHGGTGQRVTQDDIDQKMVFYEVKN
jgi:sugar/nucleoside kinase (ribokinase family)